MRKLAGCCLFAAGFWMLVSPQAAVGLKELQWLSRYAFPGEVLAGIAVLVLAYWLLDLNADFGGDGKGQGD